MTGDQAAKMKKRIDALGRVVQVENEDETP